MTDPPQDSASSFGCGPVLGSAVAAFALLLGLVAGVTGLYGYLAMSDDGLERLQLAEPVDPVEQTEPVEEQSDAEPTVYPLAHPLADTFEIQEGLNDDAMRDTVIGNRELFGQCFERVVDDDPEIRGEIRFQFSVNSDGDIPAAVVRDNRTGSDALGDCVTDAILEEWSFDEQDISGLATVRFHVLFVPVDGGV